MNDPFHNLYSIITDSAIKQNLGVDLVGYPNLGDNDPRLLSRNSQQVVDSNIDSWHWLSRKQIIFHDQEPICFDDYRKDWREFVLKSNRLTTNHLRGNSEINSTNKDQLLALSGWKDFYWFSNGFLSLEWYRYYQYARYLEENWSPRYQFSCYNRIIKDRPHRHRITQELLKLGKDRIILSYTGEPNDSLEPVIVNTRDHGKQNMSHAIDTMDFIDSFCHVVTERLFDEDRIHLTEKIFRPIVCCRPFVLVSSPNALRYLQSYGFKTFHDFWDESYDRISNHAQRLDAIATTIDQINNLDPAQCLKQMQDILLFNRNHFYNGFREIITNELYHNLHEALYAGKSKSSYYKRILDSLTQDEMELIKRSDEICDHDDDRAFDIYKHLADHFSPNDKPISGVRDYVRTNLRYIKPFYEAVRLKESNRFVV